MDAIKNLLTRNASSKLTVPMPSSEQMQIVYQAALRSPDHAWLRPSSFIEVSGKGLEKLSKIFEKYARENVPDLTDEKLAKYREAPFRAPMIIVLVCNVQEHPKVPPIEQKLSTATAAQNILLALHAMGFAGYWRTGKLAFHGDIESHFGLEKHQAILGYLYVGTPTGKQKTIPTMQVEEYVEIWN